METEDVRSNYISAIAAWGDYEFLWLNQTSIYESTCFAMIIKLFL